VRLDALARWLQDAAWADVVDSGLEDDGVWVVRRLHLRVERFPRFGEDVEVATFCSGAAKLWAERRSTIAGHVEAVALWVHLDARGIRPRPLPDGFDAVYGAAAGGRTVRARLTHPAEPRGEERPWRFRAADLDLAAHVNNAVYWQVLEEEEDGLGDGLVAEIEHRAPAGRGPAVVHRDGDRWWITQGGELLATIAVTG
jgi:acyl-ACP thioesterase